MADYTIYIDEAGDLGANRGTQWFVLSAVIVEKCNEEPLRHEIEAIKHKLNLQTIHFRTIKDFQKRCYIVDSLARHPFTIVNVLFDTTKYDLKRMPNNLVAYNYLCRFLLERVSWYLRDIDKTGDIVLSSRGTSRDSELIEYINRIVCGAGNRVEAVFDKTMARTASSWDMLQLADVCATSMYYAYEVGRFGFAMPCFSHRFAKHFYQRDRKLLKYGIKFFDNDMNPDANFTKQHKICTKA